MNPDQTQQGAIICPSCYKLKQLALSRDDKWITDKTIDGFKLIQHDVKKAKGILPEWKLNSIAIWVCTDCHQKLSTLINTSETKITLAFLTGLAKKWSDMNEKSKQ